MIRRPPRSTLSSSSAASDVYKRQYKRIVYPSQRGCFPEFLAQNQNIASYICPGTGLSSLCKLVPMDNLQPCCLLLQRVFKYGGCLRFGDNDHNDNDYIIVVILFLSEWMESQAGIINAY